MSDRKRKTCACRIKDAAKIRKIRNLLRKHGDDVPEKDIRKNVTRETLNDWAYICNCEGDIISACYQEKSDWYLWTIKNLVTHPDYGKRGYGTNVAKQCRDKAIKAGAKVLAADTTFDNVKSQKILNKLGLKRVNKFCWGKGEKPANILHYVLMPPVGTKCK